MQSEAQTLFDVMLYLSTRPGIRFWRNQTGALENKQGRFVKFGLIGSSDIVGLIGPGGRFLAIECKSAKGVQSEPQKNFQAMIEKHGGKYIIARSVEDVKNAGL